MSPFAEQMARRRHRELLEQAARRRLIAQARRLARDQRRTPALFRRGTRLPSLRILAERRRVACLDRLAEVPLFRGLARRQLELLGKRAEPVRVTAGTMLAKEDHPQPQFMVITCGVAEATVGARRVGVFGPGDHFGELTLLDGEPQVPTITALTDVEGYVLGRREFWGLLHAIPPLSIRVTALVADDLRRANERLALQRAEAG